MLLFNYLQTDHCIYTAKDLYFIFILTSLNTNFCTNINNNDISLLYAYFQYDYIFVLLW